MNLIQILTNENPIIVKIITVTFTWIQAFLFYRIFTILLNIKNSKKQRNIFVLIMPFGSIAAMFLQNSILKDCLVIIPFLLLLHFLFILNIKTTLLAIFLSYFCAITVEIFINSTFVYIFKLPLHAMLSIPLYYFLAQLFGSILLYVLPKVIVNIKRNYLNFKLKISLKVIIIVNFILGILTMILETYLFSIHINDITPILTFAIMISTFLYFTIAMFSLIRTNILDKTKEDLENAKLYNQTLSLLHDNIRGFKHDFNNIVQSIGGYIALNDIVGLKDYYRRLLEECKLTNNLNILNPETINNPSIYSLLTNKYFLACEKEIIMTFSIFSDLLMVNSNMYEISRILGILLDNAIEAAEETDNKIVDIEIRSDDKKHTFIIKNSYKNTDISISQIFEKGYSTKNRNSGLGLWNVHKILSKNTNLDLYTTIENNMFCQQFSVYNK